MIALILLRLGPQNRCPALKNSAGLFLLDARPNRGLSTLELLARPGAAHTCFVVAFLTSCVCVCQIAIFTVAREKRAFDLFTRGLRDPPGLSHAEGLIDHG